MRILIAAVSAGCLAAVLAGCGGSGSTCPFGIISRPTAQGTVTDTFRTHDITIPSETDLEVDLSHSAPNGQVPKADAWLTSADCTKLFDPPYPTASGAPPPPACRTFLGPVAAGTVSSRVKIDPGRYRVFIQAYTSNTSAPDYVVDVGIWGRSCTVNRNFAP